MIGVAFSIDGMTMGFKGRHANKKVCCKNKKVID